MKRKMLAMLISAHNEELVLSGTISSAIKAGMKPADIYVVDDNSRDATKAVALGLLPEGNVMRVRRSGKGLALTKAIKKFRLVKKYKWVHIADADGAFSRNYFKVFRSQLDAKNAAATGYVRSLPGRRVSEFRAFEYTLGMEIHRRFQSMFGVIPIIPGPTSCFRSDILEKLNFATSSLTEDFDVTLQIHRQKLGNIQFIPDAVAYTQDPRTLKDFLRQITRWNRGVMQGMVKYRIGRKASPIDTYLTYQVMQNFLLFTNYFIWVPLIAITKQGFAVVALTFLFDVWLTFIFAMMVALRTQRWDIISAFPFVYVYKWLNLFVFLRAFIEVRIFRKYINAEGIWGDEKGRRYKLDTSQHLVSKSN